MSIGINKFNFFHIKTDDFYNDKHIFLYSSQTFCINILKI